MLNKIKQKAIWLLAFISYWSGAIWLFNFLNRRAKRILTFHNVMPDDMFDDATTVLSDTESGFRRKIRLLKRSWRFSVDLNDPSTLTITFDDGFVNECEVAGKILEEEGDIPAILFAVVGLIGETDPQKAPVVDLLMHWNTCVPDGTYAVGRNGSEVEFSTGNRFDTWVNAIRPAYASDGENCGRTELEVCNKAYPIAKILSRFQSEYLRLRLTGISREQIDMLRAKGWLVGSHSVNHYVFSSLSDNAKRREFNAPDDMKEIVFSYPYGETASIDELTIRFAAEAGYPGAVCNLPDGGGRSGRYFIPRMTVPDDPYLMHFELSGLKSFLKTRRLLPVIRI